MISLGIQGKEYDTGKFEAPVTDDWDFNVGKKNDVLARLSKHQVTLEQITRKIFVGLQTSADKIYVLKVLKEKSKTFICYSKEIDAEVEIEKGLLRPFLMGKDIHRYEQPLPRNVVIFPYAIVRKKAELMSRTFIQQNYPAGWNYLVQNKKKLEGRESGKMRGPNFYAYIYPKNLTEFDAIKIMTPDICGRPEMTMDEAGNLYHTTTLYSFVFKDEIKDNPKYFLGILNSKLLWFFMQSTGSVLRGGYIRFKTEYLKPFPIICSKSEEPPSRSQQNQVSTLVDYILWLKANSDRTSSHSILVISYFEQIIDALVYELYLKEEIHRAEKYFFKALELEHLPSLSEIKGDKLTAIHQIFDRLFDRKHIIRQSIFFLDTLESVRIIEGKV